MATFSETNIPPPILEALWQQRCVAYVGAGYSMAAGYPSWSGLLTELLSYFDGRVVSSWRTDKLAKARLALARGKHAHAASLLRRSVGQLELNSAIARCFSLSRLSECTDAGKKIMFRRMSHFVNIEWCGIITTNYDQLLEYAYRKYGGRYNAEWLQTDFGSSNDLAGAFVRQRQVPFFVKLHGDVSVRNIVLTTEEYSAAYINNFRNTYFLHAAMLNFCFVFIGCSMTDSVVDIRKRLAREFGGSLPMAWAVLPSTSISTKMERILRSASIEPLVYDVVSKGTNRHINFDSFLSALGTASRWNKQTIHRLNRASLHDKCRHIGRLNLLLLSCVTVCHDRTCREIEIHDEVFINRCPEASYAEKRALLAISSDERFYRMLFLASVGLLEESSNGVTRLFSMTTKIAEVITLYTRK